MAEFLAERYEPGVVEAAVAEMAASLRRVSEQLAASRVGVKVISVRYMPSDEAVFIQLEADSVAAVEEVARRSGVVFDRISETVPVNAGAGTLGAEGRSER